MVSARYHCLTRYVPTRSTRFQLQPTIGSAPPRATPASVPLTALLLRHSHLPPPLPCLRPCTSAPPLQRRRLAPLFTA
eukprot:6523585-Pyramimonas_sp.AAC.1